jgi:nitrogenase-associated protein
MASIVFYEKPGCQNNTRQKALLAAAGHTVLARNLLTERWTAERLRLFFGELPVAGWFNPSAPRIKSGELDPEHMDADEALLQMVQDPLLIRRPLMEVAGEFRAGFNQAAMDAWIGLGSKAIGEDLETCPRPHAAEPCGKPALP